jgi:hypothetical protein
MNASLIRFFSHREHFRGTLRGPYTAAVLGFSFAGHVLPT